MKNATLVRLVLTACLLAWSGEALAATLSITARNDKPGPVTAVIELLDNLGAVLLAENRTWDKDDNTFSVESVLLSEDVLETARVGGSLRITFIFDVFGGPGDADRNLFIDNLDISGDFREAEDFDATGGTDVAFPGCGMAMVGGRTVADCGNENDFVEYFLSGDDDDDDDDDDD